MNRDWARRALEGSSRVRRRSSEGANAAREARAGSGTVGHVDGQNGGSCGESRGDGLDSVWGERGPEVEVESPSYELVPQPSAFFHGDGSNSPVIGRRVVLIVRKGTGTSRGGPCSRGSSHSSTARDSASQTPRIRLSSATRRGTADLRAVVDAAMLASPAVVTTIAAFSVNR